MPWQIKWSDEAVKDIIKLDKTVYIRIIKKVESTSADPHKFFKRLKGADDYKLRVGDYRVIALLFSSSKTIFIEKVGHRSNVYKK